MDIKFSPQGRASSYYSFDNNNLSLGYDKFTKYYSYPSGSSRYEFEQLLCCDGTFYDFYNNSLDVILDSSLCWGQWLHIDYSYDFTGISYECSDDDEHCCDYAYKVYYGFTDEFLHLDYSFKSSSYFPKLFDDFVYEYCQESLYYGSFDEDCNAVDYVYDLESATFDYYPSEESVEFQDYLDRVQEAYDDLLAEYSNTSVYCSNIGPIVYHQGFWGYKCVDCYYNGFYHRVCVFCDSDDDNISDYVGFLHCLESKYDSEVEYFRDNYSDFELLSSPEYSINCSFWATCSIFIIEKRYSDVASGDYYRWSCRDGSYNYDKKVLGYYSDGLDIDNKVKISLSDNNGFSFIDSAFYIVLNVYDYLDCGVDYCEFPLFLEDLNNGGNKLNVVSGGKFKITPIFRQVVGCIRIKDNKVYLVENGYLDSDDESLHSFCVSDDIDASVKSFDIYEYYLNGSVVEPQFHNLNNFGHCFNFELVEVSGFMACSDECILGLIDAINNFRSALTDDTGEINTNLASIDDALRNFGQFISFPKSYDINVKEIPCIDFCSGATINTSTTISPASSITLLPASSLIVSAMPADYLSLVSSIISALGNLLKPSDTLQVQVAAGSTIVQNNVPVPSVTVSPAAVSVTNNVPVPSVTVNTPDTVSIDSIPCLDFCNGANLGINSVPSDLFDDLIEQLEAQENTLTAFANLFKTACNTGIGEAFSEAFNLTNCIGSVFKANDDIWNGEDTMAGIWFKALDYDYNLVNSDVTKMSPFWFNQRFNDTNHLFNILSLVRKSFLTSANTPLSNSHSVFNLSVPSGTRDIKLVDVIKRAFFVNPEDAVPRNYSSVFSFNLGGNFDVYKILNHACDVNPCNIAFCEDIPLEMPTPEVTVNNNVPVPSVTNNVPVPSVTNNVPVPSVDVNVAAPNVIVTNNVPEAPVLPDNIFINADGKTFLNNNNFK